MSPSDPEHDGGPDADQPSEPEPEPLDVDSAFAAIIAGWADAPTTGSWPAQEDLSVGRHRRADDNDEPGESDAGSGPARRRDDSPPASGGPLIPSLGPTLDPDDDDPEPEGFVPPDPPPLPKGDIVSRLAWAGVLGGPAFLLADVIAWRTAPEILVLVALAGFVGGFITLVSRMPKHRDDDGDDGAVV